MGYVLIQKIVSMLADKDTGIFITCNSNYYLGTKDYKCKTNLEDNEYKYCMQVINNKWTNCEYQYPLGEDKKCSSILYCSNQKMENVNV